MGNKHYSDEFKLEVVNDYLNSSLGCRAIAKKYNLPSKNYIAEWKKQLIDKKLISEKDISKLKDKNPFYQNPNKTKTAYEKQLEKDNLRLRAELAYFKELKRLVDEDSKKK